MMFALLNDFNHTGYDRDPAAILCDFVDGLLEESTGGKDLLLELHSLPEQANRAKSRRFRRPEASEGQSESLPTLGFIPNWSVRQMRSGVSQVSPDADQPAVIIPGSRVHRLRLRSPNLGHWTHAVRELRQVDATKVIGADVDRLSWEGYSFSKVVETQNLAVAATTAPIGWDGRGTFSELVTSPYLAFRRLRFVRFWAEAVQDSVTFLNQFTSNESLYGADAFAFSLTGLPTPDDLTTAMRDMRSGSLTVEMAHSTYFFPKYAKREDGSADNA
ncbi:hypothetical protein [Microbacterium sp.]|uniref:hypothetical protein n=1 Tax=Microbacterium sp. TaxID=51671 RepID=UPI002734C635|nr:hypothetical protein [Microbacterium sp.]MDP3952674.1 hypothetical protein [Microbacterium sp.]